MTVGEKILVNDNEIIMYKDDCTVCDRKPNHYVITLESHQPQLDLGGQLGKQDTIVLKYTYGTDPNGKNYEKFFLAKGWGHVRWQQFENDVLKYDIILNKISGNNPVFPSGGCAGPLPCSSINLPTNLKAQCSPDKTKVTLSWNYAPGASFYSLRVDNFTTGGWDNSCQASAGDFCKDTVDTKFTLFINPTHQYHWWLHSRNSCQQWSERVSGPDFNCNQNSPTPTTSSIPGDINHDGKVDSFDYIIFLSKYGSNDPNCDFNNNGIVDLADYTILLFNYKQ